MLVNFGAGKCPLCGDFGKAIDKKTMHCPKCEIAFDDFVVMGVAPEAFKNYGASYWN